MNTNYPKTLAVTIGVLAFVAFFAMFAALTGAQAATTQASGGMDGGLVAFFVIAFLAITFLPTIVANSRRHRSRVAITVLNVIAVTCTILASITAIIFGAIVIPLTGLMWIIALVWACTGDVEPLRQYVPPPQTDKRWANLRSDA